MHPVKFEGNVHTDFQPPNSPQKVYFWSTIYRFTGQHAASRARFKNHVQCSSTVEKLLLKNWVWPYCSSLLLRQTQCSHRLPSDEACAVSHVADCTSNAKLHNITKHCAAPTASISNPCFVFLFLIFTKLYTARWQQADFDGMKPKMDSLWSGFGLSRVQNQRTTGWGRLPAVSSGSGECWCCAAHR